MFDPTNYNTLKLKNAITVVKNWDGSMKVISKNFDNSTGDQIGISEMFINITDLLNKIVQFQTQLNSLNMLIVDFQALPLPPPPL